MLWDEQGPGSTANTTGQTLHYEAGAGADHTKTLSTAGAKHNGSGSTPRMYFGCLGLIWATRPIRFTRALAPVLIAIPVELMADVRTGLRAVTDTRSKPSVLTPPVGRTGVLVVVMAAAVSSQLSLPPGLADALKLSSQKSRPGAMAPPQGPAGAVGGRQGLDRSIDPREYCLGSGDALTAYLWGATETALDIEINAEGNAVIPQIGSVQLAGLSVEDARAKLDSLLSSVYRGVSVAVELSRIKTFKVYVSGAVSSPGAYTVDGATRVSDLIEVANGVGPRSTKPQVERDALVAQLRRMRAIQIRSARRPVRYADLALFYNAGSIAKNPYLQQGDILVVPLPSRFCDLAGAINYPGRYMLEGNDKLRALISAAGGFSRDADSSRIWVVRFADDRDSTHELALGWRDIDSFRVQADDRVRIDFLPEFRPLENVLIAGEVRYPGLYPIHEGETTLRDVITQAGGLTEEAVMPGSRLTRRTNGDEVNADEALAEVPVSAFSEMELARMKAVLTEQEGKVAIIAPNEPDSHFLDVTLRDGDRIEIAKATGTIRVSGAVANPGLIPFEEGMDTRDCIERAGGFSQGARRFGVQVVKAGTSSALSPRKAGRLSDGDMVFVPQKRPREPLTVTRDVLAVLASIATILTTYLLLLDDQKQ